MEEQQPHSEPLVDPKETALAKISQQLNEATRLLAQWFGALDPEQLIWLRKGLGTEGGRYGQGGEQRRYYELACEILKDLPDAAKQHGREIQLTTGSERIPTDGFRKNEVDFTMIVPSADLEPGELISLILVHSFVNDGGETNRLYLGDHGRSLSPGGIGLALASGGNLELREAERRQTTL